MKTPNISLSNVLKTQTVKKTRINSKKESPKVVAYIGYKPIDTSVSPVTKTINKVYKGFKTLSQNIKKLFI